MKSSEANSEINGQCTTPTAIQNQPAHLAQHMIHVANRHEDRLAEESAAKIRKYHRRTVLTSALSSKGDYELTTGRFQLDAGDRVLLLSDGVYQTISKRMLRDKSLENPELVDFSKAIELSILELGLVDDATMMAIQFR